MAKLKSGTRIYGTGIVDTSLTVGTAFTASSSGLVISGITTFSNGPVLIGSVTSTGTAGQVLQVTGGGYISGNVGIGTTIPQTGVKLDVIGGIKGTITTGIATTSGAGLSTSFDFTGIPSWVKRVTVMFNGVSTNGTSSSIIQIGSGSVDTTGYLSATSLISSAVTTTNFTNGWGITCTGGQAAASILHGSIFVTLLGSNVWTVSGTTAKSDNAATNLLAGSKTLSGTLDRVRITTVNGTDTYDAGTINILYEG